MGYIPPTLEEWIDPALYVANIAERRNRLCYILMAVLVIAIATSITIGVQ